MTLTLAKNCKVTWKSDIDDIMNTSKMLDMPQNFLMILITCVDDFTYQVSCPSKVFNLLTVSNMFEKKHL